MASTTTPRIFSYKAAGAIPKGSAVIFGADSQHVTVATGPTTLIMGIAQSASTAAEDLIEVATNGGGAKALAGGTIARGDLLTSDAAGALVATTTATNRIIAIAHDAAVAGDIFAVEVAVGLI
jgi:hypothetical protein